MKFRAVLRSITNTGPVPIASTVSDSPRELCACVLGVGYVGESLVQQFGRVVQTIGYDVSPGRISQLQEKYVESDKIQLTTDTSLLSRGTHFFIAVPTPLREDRSVNLEHVQKAISTIVSHARPGSCIIIESSVPVGTTRKLLGPYKLTFHGGMSPERIDPGRMQPTAENIPKVVSALTPKAMKQIFAIYALVYKMPVPVSTPEVAEMTKLYENCYRMVNIAYVNEISDACLAHGIDPEEMIAAAATKPFGFQPFFPGLGVGGHCLPVNPWYLLQNNKRLRVLELATTLMADRPAKQARKFHAACPFRPVDASDDCMTGIGPRILVVGLGFKNGQTNLAFSPALSFAETMRDLGCARLAFYDPTISQKDVPWMEKLDDTHWNADYLDRKFDGVVVCNKLDAIDITVLDCVEKPLIKDYA